MNEFGVRVWRREEKQMYLARGIYGIGEGNIMVQTNATTVSSGGCEVMFWLGLKDRDKGAIFWKDLVEYTIKDKKEKKKVLCVVSYNKVTGQHELWYAKMDEEKEGNWKSVKVEGAIDWNESKVVGNAFQPPAGAPIPSP